jgi:ubiquinone/menaquinone biosynthesis C-methylase UbiE
MLAQTREHHKYLRQYFDREFKDYDNYKLENWRLSYLQRIFCALNVGNDPKDLYLDIGVGGSGYTVIETTRKGCKSVGVDISLEGVKKARRSATLELGERSNLCNFVVGLAENLPFRDGTFTKISSIAVLEHVPDDKQAIAEIARVIKPSGEVFITVPNAYRRILPVFWLPYYVWDKKIGHLRHYKAENLVTEFSHSGFLPSKVSYSGHLIKVLQNLLSWIFPSFGKVGSRLWWKLEEMDLKSKSPRGLQLTLLMRKD